MAKPSTRLSSVRLDSFLKALNASESTEVLLRLQFKEQEQSTLSDILTKTITKIGAESTDMTSRQQLQLALRVVQVCQDHVQFSTALLSDSSIRSLSDVAIKHYCSGGAGVIAAIKAPGIKSFRSALLAQVPTAVLYAVVSGNQLNLAPDLQTTLMKVLSLAIQENFDMSKGSLGNLVSQQAFQELIPNVKDRPMVRRTLERLQRLQNLVMDARDLKYLLNTPFASAQEIAAVKLEQFSEMLLQHNTPEDSINDIYSNALKISRSAEQLFTDIIRARQDVPILAVSGKIEPEKSKPTVTTTAEESIDLINLTTLFNDLDGVQTDSSTTVLSPAAYLVDLLQLLKRASLAPQSKSLPEAESPKNALDVLLSRRPDLSEIELSKENTEVPVRYMDLAIEVMEAFIKRQANDNLSHIAETEKQDIQLEEKKNADPHASDLTQKIVYQDQVGKKVYPMAVFPYNHAIACSREYLRARDLSRHLLLQTFRSDHALSGKSFGSSMTPCDVSMAKITNNRRIAAEYLGLQPGDFVAITQEAFQTMEFIERLKIHHVELLEKSYNRLIGAVSTAEYWGYHKEDAVSANFDMLDPSSSKRLSQVKLQLLPRAGISHSDLLRVLNTRFLGNRLVINVQQNGKYTDSLDGMRIQDSLTIDGDLKAAPKLSESTLLDLQAFIRLWHKLGWSIEDTDTAIIGLSRHKPRGKGRVLFPTLDGDFIERLAAAKKVADLTGCAIAELIPFWGPMDSLGPHSIYKRLFWSSGWVDLYPSLAFRRDDDSDTQQQPTIRDNMEPLLRALRMEQRDANLYMEIVGISYDSKWTLDHFSQLYRHHKMCSILGLTSSNYQNWYQLCLLDADPFLDPQSTLSVIERWFRLRDDSIPIKTVVDLLHPSFVAGERPKESSLTFIRDLLKGLSNIHKEFQIYTDPKLADDNQIFSQEAFLTTCEAMFNAEIAQTLVSIIEGTFTWQGNVILPEGFTVPQAHRFKCSQPKANFIRFSGILLDEEQTSLFGLANNVEWTDAVKSYYDAPRKIIGFLSQQIGVPANQIIQKLHQPAAALPFIVEKEDSVSDAPLSGSDQDAALEKAPPSAGDQDAALEKAPPSASDQDAALEKAPPSASDQDAALENGLISRRKFVIQRIVPAVQKIANTNLVMKLLENCFPGLSGDVIKCLLEVDQASISDNKNILLTPTLLDAAKKMKSDERIENAFFFPPIADGYYFIAPDDKCKKMAVDKHILTFSLSDLQHLTSTVPLNPDRIYQLELAGEEKSLTSVRFSSSQAEPQLFTPETLCPEPLASNICQAFNGLERSLLAVKLFQIDLSEVRYFQSQGMIFSKLTVSDVFKLHEFTLYRRECSNTETSAPVRYLRYLDSIPMDAGVELRKQLVAETASLTKLTISQVEDYLLSKWPTCSVKTIANILRTPREIINMLFATRMADTLGLRMVNLFEWCMLPSIPTWEEDHQLARSLKMPLSSSSSLPTAAHANQQRALQAYLLEMPFFRDQEINTPDGLFKYFLIDVQMGSELQTTRIGQAIATVQLFVQRCLLGLEKKNGIQTNVINSSKWDWMGRFTLWQANRKVFLYPENWTDPTLRDNQTEAFKVLQGKVLQNSLNLESINQMIREYIYSVNEIADLEIQSYLWEGTSGSFRGKYHIFARTRTAPYIFYYRWLEVIGVFGAQLEWYWFPWMKMDVDIPSYEVDGDNSTLPKPGTYLMPALLKDRLYLFIPQIIKKTLPSPTTDVKFGDLPGTKLDALSAQDYWEIKMGWTELRNGKWSAKQTTQTGIEVKRPKPTSESDSQPGSTANPEPKWVLPSVSSFRFRLQSRSSTSTPGSNSTPILMIHTEWLKLDSVEKRDKQTHAEIVYIGSFEMQGVRLRVSTTSIPPEKTPSLQWLTTFSRFSHHSSCENASLLVAEVESTVQVPYTKSLTIDNNLGKDEQIPIDKFVKVETSPPMPLLAVPDPKPVAGEVAGYDLSWLMAFDDTQNAAGTGLVVERYTASAVESFFGFPAPKIDATAFDTQAKTTVLTTSLSYGTAPLLMEKATSTDDLESIFGTLENIPKNMIHLAFGQDGELFRELTSPSSIYTWELGFHVILLLVERLLATQQFDLAIQLSRQVFDPTRNDKFLSKGQDIVKSNTENEPMSRLDYCWRFHPFKSHAVRTKGSTRDIVKCLDANSTPNDITLWEANPFSAHSVARQRPVIYMKRFVIKCIEILLASGDHHFRQNSLEAIPLALQRYVEASELFGPAPQAIDSPTEKSTRTYAQIKDFVDAFANSRVDMELLFPYFINSQKQSGSQKYRHGTLGFVNSTYFSVPTNPEVQALREAIDDRFFKIRHGLDIYGNPRRLPLFDPPVDVGQLVAHAANGGGTGFGALLEAIDGPMPNYRSMYLLQKALELCGELKVFADSFLIIKEKQDAEELSSLRARQDVGMQSLLTEIKRMQLKESLSTLQSLSETRKSHVTRLQFYLRLIGEPPERVPSPTQEWEDIQQVIEAPMKDELRMSPQEWQEMIFTEAAMGINVIASALEHVSAGLMALPEIITQTEPMGVGASMKLDATIAGKAMMMNAGVLRAGAHASTDAASRVSRKANLIRQLQDRRFQANQAGRDIKCIDQQILAQKTRIQIAEAEIKSQEQQAKNMQEVEEYLRTKYTSQQLYAWMEVSVRQLFYQSYLAAMDMAKAAERAFAFEYSSGKAPQFLSSNGYWDASRSGLMAGQQLALSLRRMEAYHIKTPTHDYELTKVISLRQIAPMALLSLRRKGFAEFQLQEVLFDQDFPGHYCRRIKTVSVLIPGIVGPYTGISSTLRLLEHRYRLKPGSDSSSGYYETDTSGDDRFRTDRIPITAIALSSSGQQDTGVFELNFRDERYLPFEGAGVISRWRLELPAPYPQFDYDTISDVVLTLRFTSLEGGAAWKKQASEAVVNHHKTLLAAQGTEGDDNGNFFVIDLLNDVRQEWTLFSQAVKSLPAPARDETDFKFRIRNVNDFLPFWARGQEVNLRNVWLNLNVEKDGWKTTKLPTVFGVSMKLTSDSRPDSLVQLVPNLENTMQVVEDGDIIFPATCLNGKVPRRMWLVGQYTVQPKSGLR